jgi:hypothetical protein
LIEALRKLLASYNIQVGIANALDAQLGNPQAALGAPNSGRRQDAVNQRARSSTRRRPNEERG